MIFPAYAYAYIVIGMMLAYVAVTSPHAAGWEDWRKRGVAVVMVILWGPILATVIVVHVFKELRK